MDLVIVIITISLFSTILVRYDERAIGHTLQQTLLNDESVFMRKMTMMGYIHIKHTATAAITTTIAMTPPHFVFIADNC